MKMTFKSVLWKYNKTPRFAYSIPFAIDLGTDDCATGVAAVRKMFIFIVTNKVSNKYSKK